MTDPDSQPTGPEPTGYEQPTRDDRSTGGNGAGTAPDSDPGGVSPGDPIAGSDADAAPLTTDADAQRDDLPTRPGNEGA